MFSEVAGLLEVDVAAVSAINGVDEAITVATLPAHKRVAAGDMVATVKIIPFAAERAKVEEAMAAAPAPCVSVAKFRPLKVGVVSTLLPGLKPSIVAKTLQVLEDRLAPAGATIASERRVAHETQALSEAIAVGARAARIC